MCWNLKSKWFIMEGQITHKRRFKMSILVVGAVFVDIKGFPEDLYIPDGRNIGRIEYIHGGVARIIFAHQLNCAGIGAGIPDVFAVFLGNVRTAEEVDKLLGVFLVPGILGDNHAVDPHVAAFLGDGIGRRPAHLFQAGIGQLSHGMVRITQYHPFGVVYTFV